MNFDELFAVEDRVMPPKALINIMSVIRGGAEISQAQDSLTITGTIQEYYIEADTPDCEIKP